jgi:YD repeat-containing protein
MLFLGGLRKHVWILSLLETLVAVSALGTTTTFACDSRDRLTTVTDHLGEFRGEFRGRLTK